MARVARTATYTPFALAGLVAGIALAATDHPWWVLVAMFIGAIQVRVSR